MALSNYYKENAVWYVGSNTNGYDVALSPTFETMLANDNEFDLSALLNNGSTFTQLNTGYFGQHPVVYPASNNTSMIADTPATVKYLGSAVCVSDLSVIINVSLIKGVLINITAKQGSNAVPYGYYGWDKIKNWRIVLNLKPHDSSTTNGNPVNWDSVDNWGGLGRIILKPWYYYVNPDGNFVREEEGGSSKINNYGDLPTNRQNSMTHIDYNTYITNYTEDKADNFRLTNTTIGKLIFFFEINGDIYLTTNPEQAYALNINERIPTYQPYPLPVGYPVAYIGIGEFNKSENVKKALPDNDNEKGFSFDTYAYQGQFKQMSAYLNTISAMYYFVNSTGLKWSDNKAGIGPSAGEYRQDIRLGVMYSNGVIKHNEWIIGEEAIFESSNPNKDGDYSNLPERRGGGSEGDDDDDLALQLIGENSQLAKFLHFYILTEDDVDELKVNIDSALVENPMQYLISLKEIPYYFERFISGGMSRSEIRLGPWIATSATGYRITSSVAVCPVGSIVVRRHFNNFLDFGPYTHLNLYLPYCGTVELPVDIVMGKEISVFYSFDFESLNCNAMIFCSGAYLTNVHGNLSKDYSLSATNGFLKGLSSAVSLVSLTGTLAGTFIIPSLGLVLPSQVGNFVNSLGRNYSIMRESSNDFTNFKSPQRCCLFISRPRLEDLTGYRKHVGIRCEKYGALKEFSGLTVCRNPHVNIPCTSEEKLMIQEKLENGVIMPL